LQRYRWRTTTAAEDVVSFRLSLVLPCRTQLVELTRIESGWAGTNSTKGWLRTPAKERGNERRHFWNCVADSASDEWY